MSKQPDEGRIARGRTTGGEPRFATTIYITDRTAQQVAELAVGLRLTKGQVYETVIAAAHRSLQKQRAPTEPPPQEPEPGTGGGGQ